ncbi:MAG: hypothetical protein ACKOPG_06260 [Novosphingobium sp.]
MPAFQRMAARELAIADIAEAAFFTQGRIERHLASSVRNPARVRRFHM